MSTDRNAGYEYVQALMDGLYGPKFCKPCDKVQPMQVYELAGSNYTKFEGTTFTAGFTGARHCAVCFTPWEEADGTPKS